MGADATIGIDIQAVSEAPGIPPEPELSRWIRRALAAAAPGVGGEVSVRIVDVPEMQALNHRFRDRDRPTNVLSFPAGDIAGLPAGEPRGLGDLVVCAPVLAEEARAQDKALGDHWAHILVHGTLHLLGYDHADEADAECMESLEARILAAGGVSDPYSER